MVNSSSSLAISCATSPKTRGFWKSYKEICSICTGPAFYDSGPMKLRVALFTGIFALLLGICAGAEIHSRPLSPTYIRKFDEFGALGHCDMAARLDNYAIQLQHEPETMAHIIAYGPEGEGPGTDKFNLKIIKDYLVEVRGLPKRRIKT